MEVEIALIEWNAQHRKAFNDTQQPQAKYRFLLAERETFGERAASR